MTMRRLALIGLALLALTVAADTPFLAGADLQAEIASKCADGCITFSQEEAAAYEKGIGELIEQRLKEAFQAGQADAKGQCISLI